ncbi:MAG: putative glycoside hydrolase [bacterium]
MASASFATTAAAAYRTDRIGPSSLATKTGSVDASSTDVLAVADQPNPSAPDRGVRVFKAAKKGFSGVLTYTLPSGLDAVSASGIALDLNYLGDSGTKKRWTFELQDFKRKKWVAIGDSSQATAGAWSTLHFAVTGDFAPYLNANRQMQLRYATTGKKLVSRLDLAAVAVTSYEPDPPPPPPTTGGGPEPSTESSVRSVFKGSFTASPEAIEYVATVPDLHVLSMGPSKVQSIKSVNPQVEAYHYFKTGGLHGPATRPPTGDPGWDQVVAQDLLWSGPSGNAVTQTQNGWYYVDIQDPAKRAAWIAILIDQIAEVRAQGWDSVFLDNAGVIEPSLITEYPADYSDAAYYAAVADVLAGLRAAFPDMHLIFNSYSGWAPVGMRGLELLDHADGIFFEGFSLKVSGKYFDTGRYLQQLEDFASVVRSGRVAVAMDYLATTDVARRIWSLASYLLVNAPSAYHYLAGTDTETELQQFPEDQLAIGEPLTDAAVRVDGLVVRSYTGAVVVVNPTTASKSYAMGEGTWQQLALAGGGDFPNPGAVTWTPLAGTAVSLAPNTAIVVRPAR